jgi:hypothetical protein
MATPTLKLGGTYRPIRPNPLIPILMDMVIEELYDLWSNKESEVERIDVCDLFSQKGEGIREDVPEVLLCLLCS